VTGPDGRGYGGLAGGSDGRPSLFDRGWGFEVLGFPGRRPKEEFVTKLDEIEGIGASHAQALKNAGIDTTEELLETGGSPAGRETIAEKSGLSPKLILECSGGLLCPLGLRLGALPPATVPTLDPKWVMIL
jgi:uncharacterized protein DUF4332